MSPVNDVSDYYNLHGQYNTGVFGVQVQLPILDAARKARADGAMVDAIRAVHEVDLLRSNQREDRVKLPHSLAELTTRAEIAKVDQAIAEEQLKATWMQLTSSGYGARPMTPKDEQNARILERQRALGVLDATLQVKKTYISFLRQSGDLDNWLSSTSAAQKTK